MPYITYYSQMRKKERMENLEKESKIQLNRRVTKFVPYEDLKIEVRTRTNWTVNVAAYLYDINRAYEALVATGQPLYHTFKIPKHSGGYREITAPHPELRVLQTRVVKALNYNPKIRVLEHNAAHGFVS